ncbi:hypothetical protein M408DRAFT_326950 [Serendipita vermifera MAFF 305830]|uniref:HD domain-containing protein n=1 Tax=Serendipita vermifera MAFF 305830 TaxID=933852 RepID=A0A0C2XTX7_SERVB|nr:hypothetical protein M408DRAFT_326950 [Serendipita vermifera MAFF 305830]
MASEPTNLDEEMADREETPLPDIRIIKDPIYDYIEVDSFICQFIVRPQFQRLRGIKQLGTSHFVFPSASHNRFEHCLGVMHLAKMMVEHLALQSGLGITERDSQCVQLAGLLHDLGHGPFSHVFDGQFIPKERPDYDWKHEDASELMFEALLVENDIDLPRKDINFIRDLIAGINRHPENDEKPFLFEIVANKVNGLDVDKFDYIARDTHHIGGNKCSLAALRLIKSSRVIGNHITYSNKDITNVFLVFQERWSLHKRVYTHPASRAIEYMVVDTLLAADPYMKLSQQIDDPSRYIFLTDSVLEEIERSSQPELAASRDIIKRLRTRKLYKCVDSLHLHSGDEIHWKNMVTSQNIAREANLVREAEAETLSQREVTADDIIVDWSFVHFGMKDKNPVELVLFYGKHKPNMAKHARPEEYSQTFPHDFAEVALRVYTRDRSLYGLVQAGFRAVQQQCLTTLTQSSYKTPLRATSTLPESVSTSGGVLYDGNPFTAVPPSFSGPGSPRNKAPRVGGARSGLSTTSSRESPSLVDERQGLSTLGPMTKGASAKRYWEPEDSNVNTLGLQQVKRAKRE